MATVVTDRTAPPRTQFVERPWISLPERVALSWSMASGIMTGGVWLAVNAHMTSAAFLVVMTVLFAAGAALGYLHGGILGMLGRPADMGRREALTRLLRTGLYEIPALGLAWLVAAWIALTNVAGQGSRITLTAGVVLAWGGALVICSWAGVEGWQALRNACRRWSHYRVGTAILSTTFLVLAVSFVRTRPELWGTDVRVTAAGAVVLALGATVWLVSPVVILALQLVRRRMG